ncbi:MAG: hypothetical protein FRX49_03355 [Trebouxia sp. A1-2]|nr:MAG: hypothetical protein FRX49_03355 [Trebouxia sp. A1-2]
MQHRQHLQKTGGKSGSNNLKLTASSMLNSGMRSSTTAPPGKGSCPLGLRQKALLLFDAVHLKLLLLLSFTHLHRHLAQQCADRAGALAEHQRNTTQPRQYTSPGPTLRVRSTAEQAKKHNKRTLAAAAAFLSFSSSGMRRWATAA